MRGTPDLAGRDARERSCDRHEEGPGHEVTSRADYGGRQFRECERNSRCDWHMSECDKQAGSRESSCERDMFRADRSVQPFHHDRNCERSRECERDPRRELRESRDNRDCHDSRENRGEPKGSTPFGGAGSGTGAWRADKAPHWRKTGREDTPDPRGSNTVLPPVSENERRGWLGACNVVAAVSGCHKTDLPFVQTPEGL